MIRTIVRIFLYTYFIKVMLIIMVFMMRTIVRIFLCTYFIKIKLIIIIFMVGTIVPIFLYIYFIKNITNYEDNYDTYDCTHISIDLFY